MIEIEEITAPNPMDLWELLDRHNLLSGALKANPSLVSGMCQNGNFLIWHEDGTPLALLMEFRSMDPEVIDVLVVPEDRWLGKRKAEISDLGVWLRERWFGMGFRRVQSSVPASRVNIHRIMKAMGFVEETKHDVGLRGGIRLGRKPEGLVLYGLLDSDPVKKYADPVEV